MAETLDWKITNDKDAMVGFYRNMPLYKIELTINLDPRSFDELMCGRVVAQATAQWGKLCENNGFNPKGVMVKSADDNLTPRDVCAGLNVTSGLVKDDAQKVKLFKQYQKKIDADFAFKAKHINLTPTKAKDKSGDGKRR